MSKSSLKHIFFILIFINSLLSESFEALNGGVLHLKLDAKNIIFNKKQFTPIKDNNFIVPIGYYTKAGKHTLLADNKKYFLNVKNAKYKKEILKVLKSKTNLSKQQIQRTIKERNLINAIYKKYKPKQWSEKFIYPLTSKHTSLYGNARIFNRKIRSYHSGLDFKAKMQTEIKASNDGVVEFAGNLFYAGNCVIINHGEYIFTVYAHLSNIKIKANTKIKKSQIIGLSGKSGRVTGPHLHFGTIIKGVKVNPQDFVSVINKI